MEVFVLFAVLIATCLVPTPETTRQSRAGRLFSRLKGPAIIIVFVGLMLFLLLAVLAAVLPTGGRTQAKIAKTKNIMLQIDNAFVNYGVEYDDHLPSAKDQAGLIKNLTKDNPRGIVFLSLEAKDINAQGEALDAWGTPLHMTVVDSQHLEIRSAGPDKTWQTRDDLDANRIRQE